jgi:hypothetical protein
MLRQTVSVILIFAGPLASQSLLAEPGASITVGANVQVSKPRANLPHGEVVLAADSTKPARLLAGSMIEQPGAGDSVVVYSSPDGGKTWAVALEKQAAKAGPKFADPAVAFGPTGAAHFACIRDTRGKLYLEIVSSPDGGKTWQPSVIMTDQVADRPFVTVDSTSGKFRGRLYCTCKASFGPLRWSKLAVFTSRDAGNTFDAPRALEVKPKGPALVAGPVAVLSDGSLVLPYTERLAAEDDWKWLGIWLRRSTPGGESFLDDQMLFKRDFLGANANAPYLPMLAVDSGSKQFADRLYLVWAEKTPRGMHVMLTVSKDKGVTWSKPVLLSEQVEGKSYHALLPSVAVNRAGAVGVAWYDTRDGRAGQPACHFRFRVSLDGGKHWLPSVRVSDAASSYELNDKKGGVQGKDWVGDTTGLATDAEGAFHALWIDNRTGMKQVLTARIGVAGRIGGGLRQP